MKLFAACWAACIFVMLPPLELIEPVVSSTRAISNVFGSGVAHWATAVGFRSSVLETWPNRAGELIWVARTILRGLVVTLMGSTVNPAAPM